MQEFYETSGRDEQFIKKIYPKELIRFYETCDFSLRNIIIISNWHYLPNFMNVAFLKKHYIFVYIIYFDNIEKYDKTNHRDCLDKSKSGGKSSSSIAANKNKTYTDFMKEYLYTKQVHKSNSDHDYSKFIGIPKQISTILSAYPNASWFNILDMNHYTSSKKLYNAVDFHTFLQNLIIE